MKVVISKGAKKDLSKLDQFTQRRILGELMELETSLIGKDVKKLKGIRRYLAAKSWRLSCNYDNRRRKSCYFNFKSWT